MANQRGSRPQTRGQRSVVRNNYVYGNTVRKVDVRTAIEEAPRKKVNTAARANRERAVYMNLGYVTFLVAALLVTGAILIQYIQLQADITNTVKNISKLESQLNDLRLANNEEYSRITSSMDLEEIKRIAITELGMVYASEGQIITYSNEGSDYVEQVADIPE